jgi:hypothetical protein
MKFLQSLVTAARFHPATSINEFGAGIAEHTTCHE